MDFTEEQVKNLEDVFRQNLPPDKDSLTLTEFKKLKPSKNVGNYHKNFLKSKSFLMSKDGLKNNPRHLFLITSCFSNSHTGRNNQFEAGK